MEEDRTQPALVQKETGSQNLNPQKEKVLFSWKAPARPFKKRSKEFFITVLSLAFLLGLILFFIEGILPVVVIAALVFLVYVLGTVSPQEVEYSLTNKGVFFAGRKYQWGEMVRFWFAHRFGNELLVFETRRIPARLEMVIHKEDKERLRELLEGYLVYEEPAPDFFDKAAAWLSKTVQLEA